MFARNATGFLNSLILEASASATNPQSLPSEWNAHTSYEFRYAHAQSAMEYIVKVNRLGGKAVVLALATGDDKTATFEVVVKDYISESSLPITFASGTSTEDKAKQIQDAFISAGRLNDFGALLKISIIQKLAPSLHKEGYEESRSETHNDRDNDRDRDRPQRQGEPANPRRPREADEQPVPPYLFDDSLRMPPRGGNRPLPEPIPGFDDEFEINQPRGGLRDDRRPYVPFGHDDLNPPGLGPHDPLRPHLGGGLPRPGGMGRGGMHPTFDDPLFGGQGGMGGGGYDPMAPPGARYDPAGPGGAPRDNRWGGRFPGGGFGGPGAGGRPPNPFGGYGDGDFI
ncbi:hypothetical protein K491DRAFT_689818 [Lophiostoma macrostomum CBS 122681]|uniref:Uncharacterized protein n=1 Tax=Lophiostoma macrostomum CBS 122681 TaxID=1314788 RepID=A0A6A6THD1_9PLEO|nr:hypothetical protein K491DRAFT_689818 [Lophiostoma macrostomum CBS 122681]